MENNVNAEKRSGMVRGSRSKAGNYPATKNLVRVLQERGIRHSEFARMMGWTRQDTWLILNDKRELHPADIRRVMDLLDISADELFQK